MSTNTAKNRPTVYLSNASLEYLEQCDSVSGGINAAIAKARDFDILANAAKAITDPLLACFETGRPITPSMALTMLTVYNQIARTASGDNAEQAA